MDEPWLPERGIEPFEPLAELKFPPTFLEDWILIKFNLLPPPIFSFDFYSLTLLPDYALFNDYWLVVNLTFDF